MFDFARYVEFLACPQCHGALHFQEAAPPPCYGCHNCHREYPIIDNIPRFLQVEEAMLARAKAHWEESPSFQYEAKNPLYTKEYYEEQDRWRREEVDPYSMAEYQFEKIQGLRILDIGSGSGWVVKQAGKAGAFAIGIDFAEKAAISTRNSLLLHNLSGVALQADAQHLPIRTGSIDRVYSIGVLHHIPDTEKGIAEAHRITRPKGTLFVSLYGKLFFFNKWLFPIATFFLRLMLKAPAVRDGIQHTQNYEEFYRLMDGPGNPIGRFYSDADFARLFAAFHILSHSRSHFPLRFLQLAGIPLKRLIPGFAHRFMERRWGMMCNYQLQKPARNEPFLKET